MRGEAGPVDAAGRAGAGGGPATGGLGGPGGPGGPGGLAALGGSFGGSGGGAAGRSVGGPPPSGAIPLDTDSSPPRLTRRSLKGSASSGPAIVRTHPNALLSSSQKYSRVLRSPRTC